MLAGQGVIPKGETYAFGSYRVPVEEPDNELMRRQIEAFAKMALRAAGITVPVGYVPYTVIVKYAQSHGVGEHKDDDYDTDFDWVVSFTPVGQAVFYMKHPNPKSAFHTEKLDNTGCLIFKRFLLHKAGDADNDRINITVRYVRAGAKKVFHDVHWKHK
jgi:hypothetical protein